GLTYSGYPLGCAAALASISVYEEENLVEKAAENGVYLEKKLHECLDGNPWLGEIRGKGLLQVIELVSNTDTKKPLSPWNAELSNEMKVLKQKLLSHGLFVFLRWNMLFITPPLSVSKKQIDHGVNIIKTAIHETQAYFISEGG
ncbi:aminotransferase class III-fold pyridoxal phosphate-dependent enzyme, partial [bacterium]|nr:aminotransferase class III-fold pyridoxal phosphate-dependent enzyme [bacterium]